ncbi:MULTISPECIES: GGDEF domain-containing protein [unclassified Paenibacillus]|uniref:GGDEF domain-containing protein n=1 Tax=unclassified Paenibacillus TaxID=185978 RepID=UPI001AE54560|nr:MULTISPECIES: GGDEF domain-containing protein [unclassified Paenibacillus]MBP1153668.1 diguanylate cyclase (GGDEF)-like protein [Paenibacillus sp. PvP091]MBP1170947.1 diguanylate cyclase (GGDEF)-like protein [Paenibacillus sp. PvR098]MBP2441975.1 diguanylate cyclase (GGDEF)-like protein [Paenibacillus sp. PvP052]
MYNKLPEIKSTTYEMRQLYDSAKIALGYINKNLNDLMIETETDGLTGVPNRRSFDLTLEKLVSSQTPFSLILLDIDHFKSINDTYGHLIGDEVLQLLAKTLLDLSREADLCFRYGGEEFALIVKSKDMEIAKHVAERVRTTVEKTNNPTEKIITISLGVSIYLNMGNT